jgi:sirohydrochlorin cobaltochelatase
MTRAVVLFGHGSRDPAWRAPMDAVAERIRQRQPQVLVGSAFLELQAPDLRTSIGHLVAGGATEVVVVPMFLGAGRHAREDLPRLLAAVRPDHPGVTIEASTPIGERAELLDLIADLALQHP